VVSSGVYGNISIIACAKHFAQGSKESDKEEQTQGQITQNLRLLFNVSIG